MNRKSKVIGKTGTTILCVAVAANTMATTVSAAGVQPEKDENIYVNLKADGSVDSIYAVNEFDVGSQTTIEDYGNYVSVKNLTSDAEIHYSNQRVTVTADKGKFYYQGELADTEIPWEIGISYFLDGKKAEAQELAGRTGALELVLSVKDNPNVEDTFFDNYLVQATVTLDTTKCKNIKASGATEANVGANRQLLYNIMAGEEKEFVITADVTDFEMDEITFQAIPMSFEIDIDKDDIYDQITDLKDAAKEFDDGAIDLRDGVQELKDGAVDLQDGALEMRDGTDDLRDGTRELKDGAATLKDGVSDLVDGGDSLSKGALSMNTGIQSVDQGVAAVNDNAKTLYAGAADVAAGCQNLKEGMGVLTESLKKMDEGAKQIDSSLTALSAQSGNLTTGSTQILAALEQMQNSLTTGITFAQQSTQELESIEEQNSRYAEYFTNMAGQITVVCENADEGERQALQTVFQGMDLSELTGNMENVAATLTYNNVILDEYQKEITESVAAQMNELTEAVTKLTEEYRRWDAGIKEYTGGVSAVQSAFGEFCNAFDQTVDATDALLEGTTAVTEGSAAVAEGCYALTDGTEQLKKGTTELQKGGKELGDGVDSLRSGLGSLQSGAKDLAEGIDSVHDGAKELYDGADSLYDGTTELNDGIDGLKDGVDDLKDGTQEFKDEADTMDEKVDEEIDKKLNELRGADYVPVSFVSSQNTEIGLVQFAMKTEPVTVDEEENVDAGTAVEETFWQKLLKLFQR